MSEKTTRQFRKQRRQFDWSRFDHEVIQFISMLTVYIDDHCWIAREKIPGKSQLKTNRPFPSCRVSLILKARLSAEAFYIGMPASLLSSGITQLTSNLKGFSNFRLSLHFSEEKRSLLFNKVKIFSEFRMIVPPQHLLPAFAVTPSSCA